MKKKKAEQIVPEKVAIEAPENAGSISLEDFLSKTPKERDEIYSALDREEQIKITEALSPEQKAEQIIAYFQTPKGKADLEEMKKYIDGGGAGTMDYLNVSQELLKSVVDI